MRARIDNRAASARRAGGAGRAAGMRRQRRAPTPIRRRFSTQRSAAARAPTAAFSTSPSTSRRRGGQEGNLNAEVEGPFQSNGTGSLPSVDFDVTASIDSGATSFDFDGGLTITGDGAWVGFQGDEYQLDDATFQAVKASYEQSASEQAGRRTRDRSQQFGIDPQSWVTDLTNEGTEDLDGTEVVHVSGTADVPKLVADLNDVAQQTGQASAARPEPPAASSRTRSPTRRSTSTRPTDDYSLRKIEVGLTLADPRGGSGEVDRGPRDRDLRPGLRSVDQRAVRRAAARRPAQPDPGRRGRARRSRFGAGLGPVGAARRSPAAPRSTTTASPRRRARRPSKTARACSADERSRTGAEQGLPHRSRRMALPARAVHPAGDRARRRSAPRRG